MELVGEPWQIEFEKVEQRCGYLLTSGQWSDCTFMVGSDTNRVVIQAHKLVLAMASPVFEAMFFGKLSDHNERMIHIPDIQPETFRALLLYIYTGNTDISSFDMASDLWYGAKKYMLPHLIKECSIYIGSVVGPSDACRGYELACFFEEQSLMDKCLEIISTYTNEVLNDRSFKDVELNTLITVCSLDQLNLHCELDLFYAVARYAEANQITLGRISPPVDDEPPIEKLLEGGSPLASKGKGLSPSVESSSRTSPAAELDSKPPTEVAASKPTADKENLKDKPTIRDAIEKIRFLSLTPQEFTDGPARTDLLTEAEAFAVLVNIIKKISYLPMPTGFSECRERRQPPSEAMEGPFAEPRRKFSSKPLCVAATKLLNPAEIVRRLLSLDQNTLVIAARAARDITCIDAAGTLQSITRLVAAGGIPPLVDALHHPRTGIKYDACWALINIACDGEHAKTLIEAGAVPVLVGLLGLGDKVAELAAWALGNISGMGDPAKDAVLDAGAAPALIAHIQPSTPYVPLATYVRTYRIICQKHMLPFWPRSRFEMVSPAVPYIENLLVLRNKEVLEEACWILYHLADGAHIDPQLFTPVLAARLTTLLRYPSARVQVAALGAVGSILSTTVLIDQYLVAGCFDLIMNFLICGSPSYVEYAVRAVGNILRTPFHIQQALDAGILDALRPALTMDDEECKCNAGYAITNFCIFGTASQLRVLAEGATLKPFCKLLAAERRTSYCVLFGLSNFMKKVEHNKLGLLLRMREIGVPQLLMTVQKDHGQHRDIAIDLLRLYFRDDYLHALGNLGRQLSSAYKLEEDIGRP